MKHDIARLHEWVRERFGLTRRTPGRHSVAHRAQIAPHTAGMTDVSTLRLPRIYIPLDRPHFADDEVLVRPYVLEAGERRELLDQRQREEWAR